LLQVNDFALSIDDDISILTANRKTRLLQKKNQTSVLYNEIDELQGKLSMALQDARNDITRFVCN